MAGCWPPGRGWSWRGGLSWGGGWSWRKSARTLGRASLAIALAVAVTGAARPGGSRVVGGRWWEPASLFASAPTPPTPPTRTPAPKARVAELVERGRAAYGAGRLAEALEAFEAAARLAPNAAVPHYNAAAVFFGLKQYDAARRRYLEARPLADSALRTKIDFALGNTALALGDIPAAIASYDQCIGSTARGAGLDVVRADAAINREFATKQEQSPAMPQGEGSDDPSSPRRPDRKKSSDRRDGDDPTSDGQPDDGASADGTSPGDDAEKSAGRDRPPRNRRRPGGAGGGRTTPPGATGQSPEERLDAALENIRAAQSRRLPEEPPPASAGDDQRDW